MELPSANNYEELRRKHIAGEIIQVHYDPSQLHQKSNAICFCQPSVKNFPVFTLDPLRPYLD